MVLEVLADIGRVELTRDSGGLELVTRADAREHEDVRRADGTGAQHDLLVGADRVGRSVRAAVLDAARLQRAGAVEEHPSHLRAGDHREIGSLRDCSFEEGVIRARPLPLPGRGLQKRHDTVGPAAVTAVVVAGGNPGRDGRVDELLCAGDHRRAHRDAQWPGRAVRVCVDHDVAARSQALALLEVREHVGVAPTGAARRGPRIEVTRMTADVCHVVDARAATEHPTARHHHAPVGEAPAGLAGIGGVHPVGLGIELKRRDRRRHRLGGRG